MLKWKLVELERINILKELNFRKEKGTGIPTIKSALELNGSPPAKYDTDGDNRQYFITELTIHDEFRAQDGKQDNVQVRNKKEMRDQVRDQVKDQVIERIIQTLMFCFIPKTKREILENLGLTNKSTNFKVNIDPAIQAGLLAMTMPDKPTSKNQKYITTEKGKQIIAKK